MSLNKKLANYKCKNYSDECLIGNDINIIIITNKQSDQLNTYTHTIEYNDFSLDYNLFNNSVKLLSPINYDVLTSIKIIKDLLKLGEELEILDQSFVKIDSCQYYISIYCILLTGYPFYTRYGFISDDHEEELIYNNKIRNLPFNIFIDSIINENDFKKIFIELSFFSPIKNIMKYINQYLEINNGKLKCSNPIIILLLEIIKRSIQIIKYNNKLKKLMKFYN
jgi:hypothetical protein